MGRTVFLIDADQISSAHAQCWRTLGAIEIFGNDKAVRAWQQAVAALGVSITATVAPPLREAADIDLVLRAWQLMALPNEERPERVFIVSADRRVMALANTSCGQPVTPDSATAVAPRCAVSSPPPATAQIPSRPAHHREQIRTAHRERPGNISTSRVASVLHGGIVTECQYLAKPCEAFGNTRKFLVLDETRLQADYQL